MSDVLVPLGLILVFLVGGTLFVGLIFWLILAIVNIPYVPRSIRIRNHLRKLTGGELTPSFKYIRGGSGIALDVTKKRLFLANRRGAKVYDVKDVTKVESDFKSDQYQISGVMRITVRDLANPLFEINAVFNGLTKLREIESALSLLRSATQPENDES